MNSDELVTGLFKKLFTAEDAIILHTEKFCKVAVDLIDTITKVNFSVEDVTPILTALKRDDWSKRKIETWAVGLCRLGKEGWASTLQDLKDRKVSLKEAIFRVTHYRQILSEQVKLERAARGFISVAIRQLEDSNSEMDRYEMFEYIQKTAKRVFDEYYRDKSGLAVA